jgi:hypothetical protein
VLKTYENNRGEPVLCLGGKRAVKTENRVTATIKNLNIDTLATGDIQSKREQVKGYSIIRWKAERLIIKIQEVGDGYSSDDDKDNTTLSMRRAISLNEQLTRHKGRRRML